MEHDRPPHGSEDSRPTSLLVLSAQRGSREAFDALVERHRSRLEALICLRLGPALRRRVELEDVLQDACLQAFQSIQSFQSQGEGSFFRWLGGIVEHVLQNLARHHLGTQKRDPRVEVPLTTLSRGPAQDLPGRDRRRADEPVSPERALRREERFDRLEEALGQLSRDHREVILLSSVMGLPPQAIARRMGRSPDAVCMLLLRALRQLKDRFGSTDSLRLPARALGLELADGEDGDVRGAKPAGDSVDGC